MISTDGGGWWLILADDGTIVILHQDGFGEVHLFVDPDSDEE